MTEAQRLKELKEQKNKRKIRSALIEQGREVEAMESAPGIEQMELTFECLKAAMQLNNMPDQRLFARKMAAQLTKFMVVKL